METAPNNATRDTLDRIGGDFGFHVRWSVQDHWASYEVFEAIVREGRTQLFARKDWKSLPGDVTDRLDDAEPYLTGFIKWDGCSELKGNFHWCEPADCIKHIRLLKYLYGRAFELMGREPEDPWPQQIEWEWADGGNAKSPR